MRIGRLLGPLVLLFTLFGYAQGQTSTSVCTSASLTPGSTLTWTNSYSTAVAISPWPGTTWFLGAAAVTVPANGQTTVTVPTTAAPGEYDISVTYNTKQGGSPCGNVPGQPKINIGA